MYCQSTFASKLTTRKMSVAVIFRCNMLGQVRI